MDLVAIIQCILIYIHAINIFNLGSPVPAPIIGVVHSTPDKCAIAILLGLFDSPPAFFSLTAFYKY